MTEDVSAGRLHMDVYADAKGVARGLQARVDAEMAKANVRAKIKAQIDTRGMVTEAKRAAAEATKAARGARVKLQAEVDVRSLVRSVREAAKEASAGAVIKYRAEVDNASMAKAQAAAAAVSGGGASVTVDADTARARTEIEGMRAEQEARPITIPVRADTTSLRQAGTALQQLSKIPMLAGGFYVLGTAIVAVGGGLVAMTSSAVSAAAALAAIPNLAGAGLTGLATLITGFSGVGEAVKQMQAVEGQAAQTATTAADARAAAADRVRGAQQALGDAVRNSAVQAKAAAEAVADAQWALARSAEAVTAAREALRDAHYDTAKAAEEAAERIEAADENVTRSKDNVKAAENALNQTRDDARKRIEALNAALAESALDEEAATLALQRARENMADVDWNSAASPQERAEAALAVKQAEAQLDRIRGGREDLANEVQEANDKGVDGADEVLSAEEALRQAQIDQTEAVEALKEAREDNRRRAVLAARQIRDAEYGVRDALHAQEEAREALALAQQQQGQQAQASARAIADAQRNLADAQKAATDTATEQTASQVALEQAMDKLSPAGQRFATFLSNVLLPRLGEMKKAIQESLLPGIQEGITRAMPFLDTLQTGMEQTGRIIGDFATRLGRLFGSDTFNADTGTIMKSNNRVLRDFLASALNLVKVFSDLAVVAGPKLAEPFAAWVRSLTRGWKEAAQVNRESGAMGEFFDRVRTRVTLLKDIFGNLFSALKGIGTAAAPTGDSLLGTLERTTQRWADFANSDMGRKRMEEFFEAVEPATRAVGDLVAQLTEMLVKLSEGGAEGGVTAFIKTLTAIVNGINAILEVPGASQALGWLFTLAGIGGALGFVSGVLLKMGGNLQRIVKIIPGGSKALTFLTTNLKMVGTIIRTSLMSGLSKFGSLLLRLGGGALKMLSGAVGAIGRGLLTLGTKIFPMIVRLAPILGRAISLMFGPWGIAIAAVVGLFVLLYNKVDWFRNGVQTVMRAVVTAFNWVVSGAKHLWSIVGSLVLPKIEQGMRALRTVATGVFNGIKVGLRALGGVFSWLWNNAVKPAWAGIRTAITVGWKSVIKPALSAMWDAAKTLGGWFEWLWDKAIKPAWGNIRDAISTGWTKIEGWLGAFDTFIRTTLPGAFNSGVTAIKGWWDKLKGYAQTPIKFVVDTLWNEGLRRVINAIPGVDEIGPIDTNSWASGTARVLPGHTPGRDVHHFTSPTGGRLNLSGGEAIMRPEFTDRLGEAGVNMLNAAARSGKGALEHALAQVTGVGRQKYSESHFARGGVFRSAVNRTLDFFLGGVMPLEGATSIDPHDLPYYNTGAGWAGDLNSPGDLANPPSRVLAWMPGKVGHVFKGYGDEHGRYGNHVVVNNDGGGSSWFAHLSSIAVSLGEKVAAGQMLGRVGATGNVKPPGTGAHLHFEVRGAPVTGGIGPTQQAPVKSAAQIKAEKEADGWRDRIGRIKDALASVPDWLSRLGGEMGPWAGMVKGGIQNVGRDVIQWLNEKIPNEIKVPKLPDIPLPDNPIPNLFDKGGDWRSGVLGVNLSGRTETVMTNENIVDTVGGLAVVAKNLRSMITDPTSPVGGRSLVDNLSLSVGNKDDVPEVLSDLMHSLRLIEIGGLYSDRVAPASV